MIKVTNTPQEQSAQEEALPESLDHDDLEASEMESVSGGAPVQHTITCPVIAIIAVLIGHSC